MLLGKFTYKQNKTAGGHDIHYQGPLDASPRLLCTTTKTADGKWEVPLPNGPLGPFKDRWHAGYAYLSYLLDEPAKTLDTKVRKQWSKLDIRRTDGRVLTEDFAGKVYDILVVKCKAAPDDKDGFIYAHTTKPHTCTEWRFCGILGFGGKFRNGYDRIFVDCYSEDEDPETRTIIAETNEALYDLFVKVHPEVSAA